MILGIGNQLRGDDGLGPQAALLIQQAKPQWPVRQLSDLSGVLDYLEESADLCLLDCLQGAGPVGSLHSFDLLKQTLPPIRVGWSSHGFNLPALLGLSRHLGQQPRRLLLFGLEGACFAIGQGLSSPVAANLETLCRRVITEVQDFKPL
ncbi:MAG: hydrogenase maturation protease [bacterium]|nr:hydrogenase maturation protease [bacterium]